MQPNVKEVRALLQSEFEFELEKALDREGLKIGRWRWDQRRKGF